MPLPVHGRERVPPTADADSDMPSKRCRKDAHEGMRTLLGVPGRSLPAKGGSLSRFTKTTARPGASPWPRRRKPMLSSDAIPMQPAARGERRGRRKMTRRQADIRCLNGGVMNTGSIENSLTHPSGRAREQPIISYCNGPEAICQALRRDSARFCSIFCCKPCLFRLDKPCQDEYNDRGLVCPADSR